jgi:uncharacterized damage-inducible protein DinB
MIGLETIRECFRFSDWAWDRLLAAVAPLTDAQLDQPFEMGPGSLRATLRHLYGAERNWLARWRGCDQPQFPQASELAKPAEFDRAHRALVPERSADVANLDFSQTCTYTNPQGRTYTFALGDVLLHVCNHGIHHRAQAVNMLRRLGQPPLAPGLDYIFMRLDDPVPPALDVPTLRAYHIYSDWARNRLHEVARPLTDDQLDRPFDLGVGSLRATLLHIAQAEQWWLDNWTQGSGHLFPPFDERVPVTEITRRFDQTIARRNQMLASITDADLQRIVTATPRPNVQRVFPLGVTMLQLCVHGTHHRAQALNMLRRVSATVPELDFLDMVHEQRAGNGGRARQR